MYAEKKCILPVLRMHPYVCLLTDIVKRQFSAYCYVTCETYLLSAVNQKISACMQQHMLPRACDNMG
jgi:hypothetical protein